MICHWTNSLWVKNLFNFVHSDCKLQNQYILCSGIFLRGVAGSKCQGIPLSSLLSGWSHWDLGFTTEFAILFSTYSPPPVAMTASKADPNRPKIINHKVAKAEKRFKHNIGIRLWAKRAIGSKAEEQNFQFYLAPTHCHSTANIGDPRILWVHNSRSPLFSDSISGLFSWFWGKTKNKLFFRFFFGVFWLYKVIASDEYQNFLVIHDSYKQIW